jgi:hypothetical protein
MLKPPLKFSTTLILRKLTSITDNFMLERYSWFAIPDHCWVLQKHPTSDHQTSPNPIYHPSPKDMMTKPRARNKPERGETN